MNSFTAKLISSKSYQISSKECHFQVNHNINLFTSTWNWTHLREIITFQVNHINFGVNYNISSKPQPQLIYLKFWQIYLILSFEVNKPQFLSKLYHFQVNHDMNGVKYIILTNHNLYSFTLNFTDLPDIEFWS